MPDRKSLFTISQFENGIGCCRAGGVVKPPDSCRQRYQPGKDMDVTKSERR